MKSNIVITIGRQYGSGGRLIGKEVAEKLGIPFYDKELIDLAAKECGYSPEFIKANEQRAAFGFLSNLAAQGFSYSKDTLPPADTLFIAQCKVIQDIAEKGSCVIVGRCGDYVLRDRADTLHVFIRSEMAPAIKRVTENYGVREEQAAAEIKRINKNRAAHCRRYTDRVWGACENYSMMLDSSIFGVDGSARVILAAVGEAFAK